MRNWSGSLRCSTRPGTATMSRPSGFTRRNSRSRRLGDSEHDRGERAGAFAAARPARLAPGADQDRVRPDRIRRVQRGTPDRGGGAAAALRRANADVRHAYRGRPGGRHRYGRASALDEGEASLTGMLLLDLPDHDSVVTGSAALVDRLVKQADMLVWVLDP